MSDLDKLHAREQLVKVFRSYDNAIEEYNQHHEEMSADWLTDARENLVLALTEFFVLKSEVKS